MERYGWLEEDTRHCLRRAKERAGLNERKARKMIELAKVRGITMEDCTWSIDKRFLQHHSDEDVVAVAYNGFCFVLERYTMNCITMFRLPKRFGKKKTFYKSAAQQFEDYSEYACG